MCVTGFWRPSASVSTVYSIFVVMPSPLQAVHACSCGPGIGGSPRRSEDSERPPPAAARRISPKLGAHPDEGFTRREPAVLAYPERWERAARRVLYGRGVRRGGFRATGEATWPMS